ncbi:MULTISPECIES: VWA domain-containing protein [Bacillaceae]|uniref:VWA domain-containing protein n=1 Tax=Bacillaceae TaxID=186817 RepID=UPI002964D62A|nr:VWA domain-containing protein [Bacillus infantis]MDW2879664.1 VWA domain-containing protein [Bacillus infantis]
MRLLVRGERAKLDDFSSSKQLEVAVEVQSGMEVDVTCFGLDGDKKLSDDRYMIFYNQLQSPAGEISMKAHSSGAGTYEIDLDKLHPSVKNLVFTAAIDGEGTMSLVSSGTLTVKADGQPILQYSFTGSDFQNEKAIIIGELYLKDIWRIASVGKGFDGGLAALLQHFGGEVAEDESGPAQQPVPEIAPATPHAQQATPAQPTPAQHPANSKKVMLEKKMEQKAPKILDLSKKVKVSLEKAGLQDHNAKVALCLDISGSMAGLYRSGKIQEFAERILALGTRFDDDGSIDIFLFGQNAHHADELTIDNFNGFVNRLNQAYPLEGGTYYGKVMKEIRQHYFGSAGKRSSPEARNMPVYVMFVTDGATFDERETRNHIQNSSYEPIFWQFMAIGKSNRDASKKKGRRGFFKAMFQSDFTFLEELDNMDGRYLDNADFFSVEDPKAIAEEELYDLLMQEYPEWVKKARSGGLIR